MSQIPDALKKQRMKKSADSTGFDEETTRKAEATRIKEKKQNKPVVKFIMSDF